MMVPLRVARSSTLIPASHPDPNEYASNNTSNKNRVLETFPRLCFEVSKMSGISVIVSGSIGG